MPKKKYHQLNADNDSEKTTLLSDLLDMKGKQIQSHKSFGCGIDIHKKFAQISVIVINNNQFL